MFYQWTEAHRKGENIVRQPECMIVAILNVKVISVTANVQDIYLIACEPQQVC